MRNRNVRNSLTKRSERGEKAPVRGFANMLYVAAATIIVKSDVHPMARDEGGISLWILMNGQWWMLISSNPSSIAYFSWRYFDWFMSPTAGFRHCLDLFTVYF